MRAGRGRFSNSTSAQGKRAMSPPKGLSAGHGKGAARWIAQNFFFGVVEEPGADDRGAARARGLLNLIAGGTFFEFSIEPFGCNEHTKISAIRLRVFRPRGTIFSTAIVAFRGRSHALLHQLGMAGVERGAQSNRK